MASQVVAPYYARPRRTPPRTGTTLFVAGLNFITTERVRLRTCLWRVSQGVHPAVQGPVQVSPGLSASMCTSMGLHQCWQSHSVLDCDLAVCSMSCSVRAGGSMKFVGNMFLAKPVAECIARSCMGLTCCERCVAQEVEAKFGKYGTCKEARIVRNPQNGESRGFGFVAMKYEEVWAMPCTSCCAGVMGFDRLKMSRAEVVRQLALELSYKQGSAGVWGNC